jgi:hypothetical protein
MKNIFKQLTAFALTAMIVLPVFGFAMQASAGGDPDTLMWGDFRGESRAKQDLAMKTRELWQVEWLTLCLVS